MEDAKELGSMKGGTNVGTILAMLIAIALILFGTFSFYDGIASSYNVTATSSTSLPEYNKSVALANSINSTVDTMQQNTTLSLENVGRDVSIFTTLAWGAAGAVVGSISLVSNLIGLETSVLDFIVSILHLPNWMTTLINAAIVMGITLIILNAVNKWNIKDDTR